MERFFDQFGFSVFLSGDTAIVGATGAGSAYIFEFNGASWIQTAKLISSTPESVEDFGNSVSISGDTAIVGDGFELFGTGSAYIFEKNGVWPATETEKINASDGENGDNFGTSVSISGDTAFVGAVNDDDNGDNAGAVYIFDLTSNGEPDPVDNDGDGVFADEDPNDNDPCIPDDQSGACLAITDNDGDGVFADEDPNDNDPCIPDSENELCDPEFIEISTCKSLTVEGATYQLTESIFNVGTCITIDADNITLDGNTEKPN